MSLVCFPFKVENSENLIRNIKMAAGHPRVSVVLCVGVEEEDTFNALKSAAPDIQMETGKRVEVILQKRMGKLRPGKGDGMNTALKYLLDETDCERIHFYDADITSFGPDWITKAEAAADFGFGVVRHYFPRARTDAMITWMITRTGLALIWPHSGISWIEQPLGGELLFKREVVKKLVKDKRVMNQSDWGIDTLYTFATVQYGFRVYETYMQQGKAHSLYGKLTDLRTMLVECFSAIQSLKKEKLDDNLVHRMESASEVPDLITQKIGFDFEGTLGLLKLDWSDKQEKLLKHFPSRVQKNMIENKTSASFSFMDENTWMECYLILLEHFKKGDSDWEELIFKLWILRVLNYTTTVAIRGYDFSQRYLHEMVHQYRMKAGAEQIMSHKK